MNLKNRAALRVFAGFFSILCAAATLAMVAPESLGHWFPRAASVEAGAVRKSEAAVSRDSRSPESNKLGPAPGNLAFYSFPYVKVVTDVGTSNTLATQVYQAERPAFSTNGAKLLFTSPRDYEPGQGVDIYAMNPNGTDQRRLTTDGGGWDIAFSDGSSIERFVFVRKPDDYEIVVVNYFTRAQTIVKSSPNELRWPRISPDGATVTYTEEDSLRAINIDGTNDREVVSSGIERAFFVDGGTRVIYIRDGDAVYTNSLDGTDETFVVGSSEQYLFFADLTVSPDGLKFAMNCDTGAGIEENGICTANIDGSGLRAIGSSVSDGKPVFSPDGSRVAYVHENFDNSTFEIRMAPTEGGPIETIQTTDNDVEHLGWAPAAAREIVELTVQTPIAGGRAGLGTVFISEAAPTNGAPIFLSSTDYAVANPGTFVTVPAGQFFVQFEFTTGPGTTFRSADIIATRGARAAVATVSVTPSAPDVAASNLTAPPVLSTRRGFTVGWTVTNDGEAPTPAGRDDRIYLSPDDQLFNGNDIQLFQNYDSGGPLGVGQSRIRSSQLPAIPESAAPVDGTYYLFVYVGFQMDERGGNFSNNAAMIPVQVSRNGPDLVISNIAVPTLIEPDAPFSVDWTVTNQGPFDTETSFTHRLYVSFDETVGNADDVLIASRVAGTLAASASITESADYTIPSVPSRPTSDIIFYAVADTENTVDEGAPGSPPESNNTTASASRFEYNVADLQVHSVIAPADVESETSFAVSWTTANGGLKPAGSFAERVYFSIDNQADAGDLLLGNFPLPAGLGVGESINRAQTVTIPTTAVSASGNYFIYVVTDALGQINEGVFEGNNATFEPAYVVRRARPDLRVSAVTAPANAFFDQEIQVQLTVTNDGPGPTNVPYWTDRILIGAGTNSNGASSVASVSNVSSLNPGESYIASVPVRIPRGLTGEQRIFVVTDADQTAAEENESNNESSRAITLNVPPLPDLRVGSVQAPDEGFAGAPIEVSWSVSNDGDGATPPNTSTWEDGIFLSRDQQFDPTDRLIGSRSRSGVLPETGNYAVTNFEVNLPPDAVGQYFVFVVADYANRVYEFQSENNNDNYDRTEPGSPLTVAGTPPDLETIGPLSAPANETAGRSINVQFAIRNVAPFDANGNWSDAVYLSTDQVFDPQTDSLLGSVGRANVAAGNQYAVNVNVALPNCLNGTYYLFGVADSFRSLYEFDPLADAEANNVTPPHQIEIQSQFADLQITSMTVPPVVINGAMPVSWTVRNFGSAPATGGWTDQIYIVNNGRAISVGAFDFAGSLAPNAEYARNQVVYIPLYLEGEVSVVILTDIYNLVPECSFENNNQSDSPTTGAPSLADLKVTAANAPPTAAIGQPFGISWTVTNDGDAMSGAASWLDGVYLSADAVWSDGDHRLGSALSTDQLAAGESYTQAGQASAPNVPPGNYFLFIRADDTNSVEEGVDENNNISAAIPITLTAPDSDLSVTNVSAPAVINSGQPAEISWTVTNGGGSTTLGQSWTDYVYLSRDSIIDQTDPLIAFVPNNLALGGGASYTRTHSANIPSGLTGEFRIIVVTDRNNQLAESNESNNVSMPFQVTLQLPPPVDFRVAVVTAPAFSSPGEDTTFEWSVQNFSGETANGTWQDSVYLSADAVWDSGDALVGRKERVGVVGPMSLYTETLTVPLAPVEPGQYYVIVRVDSRNAVRESDESNNLGASVSQTNVTYAGLTLGVPLATTLFEGQERHFRIGDVPLGETLLIKLDGETGSRNELFTRAAFPASRSEYDVQSVNQGAEDQENVVAETIGSLYYTMARADFIPPPFADGLRRKDAETKGTEKSSKFGQNATISAEIVPFSVRSVSPESAGNAGYASLQIEGARFAPDAIVKLVRSGQEIVPVGHAVGAARIAALFDLRGKPAGDYDVVVTNPGNSSAILESGFEITNGGGHELRVAVLNPTPTRGGVRRRFTFSVANDGRNDARNVPVFITTPSAFNFEIDRSNMIPDSAIPLPPGIEPSQVPLYKDFGPDRVLMLYAPLVRAGQSVEIRVDLDLPVNYGEFPVTIRALPPMEEWAAAFEGGDEEALVEFVKKNSATFGTQPPQPNPRDCWLELFRQVFFAVLGNALPEGCAKFGWALAAASFDTASSLLLAGATGNLDGWNLFSTFSGRMLSVFTAIADCADDIILPLKFITLAVTIGQILNQLDDCLGGRVKQTILYIQPFSFDPNEKLGPAGFGPQKWIGKQKPIEYRINFENLATAGAPAQVIKITDVLPPTLDPRTVRLTEIGFNHKRIVIPPNRSFFQTRRSFSDVPEEPEALISAGVNPATATVSWTITAIDKQTNERPLNPLVGLLPPNNAERDGEGYVIFTVAPRAGTPTGAEIANTATIIFDENEPIITNATSNTLDSEVPSSVVAPLPSETDDPIFIVNWTGSDPEGGSGLADFELLVSEDGGSYRQVVADTVATSTIFAGRPGITYGFVTVARDNAGNLEAIPPTPDTVIRVRGGAFESDVAPRPEGDNDGAVNDADVSQIRRFALRMDQDYALNEFQRADSAPLVARGDGRVSLADVMQARRFAAGLDGVAGAFGPNAEVGGLTQIPQSANSAGAGRQVRATRVSRVGSTLSVAVELESEGDETGISFTLGFDPAKLTNPTNFVAGSDAAGASVAVNATQPGIVGVVVDRPPTQPFASGSRQVLTFDFDVLTTDATANLAFSAELIASEAVNGAAATVPAIFVDSAIQLITPTSAGVEIAGTVRSPSGQPIAGVQIDLTDENGRVVTVRSNSFGRYRFAGVASGRIYTLTARSRKIAFLPPSRIVDVRDSISDLDFVGDFEGPPAGR